jgi:hypothetical protein
MFFGINLVLVKLILLNILVNGVDADLPFHKAEVIGGPLEALEARFRLWRHLLHVYVLLQSLRDTMFGAQTGTRIKDGSGPEDALVGPLQGFLDMVLAFDPYFIGRSLEEIFLLDLEGVLRGDVGVFLLQDWFSRSDYRGLLRKLGLPQGDLG